jgi:DnaJ-class molecular chaperone
VFIEVAPHPFFRREGNNLACDSLNFTTLALGGSIDVPTLDGTESFKVPEGTRSNASSGPGQGMRMYPAEAAAIFLAMQAVTPKKPAPEQRAALEQLARTLPKEKFEPVRERRGRRRILREGQRYFG